MVLLVLLGCVECDPSVDDTCRTPSGLLTPHQFLPEPEPPPPVHEQIHLQPPQADVLFVFDNSLATDEGALARMSEDLPSLFDALEAQAADFHVGVALSKLSPSQGEILGWLSSRERHMQLFSQAWPSNVDAGYGRLTAYRALEVRADQLNAGFRRTDAELHVIFVSGQDDLSLTPDATEFTSWLRLDPDRGGWAHALVPEKGSTLYRRYAEATGGQVEDLHGGRLDYAEMFEDLLPPRLYLSQPPADASSIQVKLLIGTEVRVHAEVCTPDTLDADCSLVYESGQNALDWVVAPDADVRSALVTYEPAH